MARHEVAQVGSDKQNMVLWFSVSLICISNVFIELQGLSNKLKSSYNLAHRKEDILWSGVS